MTIPGLPAVMLTSLCTGSSLCLECGSPPWQWKKARSSLRTWLHSLNTRLSLGLVFLRKLLGSSMAQCLCGLLARVRVGCFEHQQRGSGSKAVAEASDQLCKSRVLWSWLLTTLLREAGGSRLAGLWRG